MKTAKRLLYGYLFIKIVGEKVENAEIVKTSSGVFVPEHYYLALYAL